MASKVKKFDKEMKAVFTKTINLPKTNFVLHPKYNEIEPANMEAITSEFYHFQKDVFNDRPIFTLHDGPPYANGNLHMGHFVNKGLKDIINRYKILRGYQINYVPGWDCHGLPIEHQVRKNNKDASKWSSIEIRQNCMKLAQETISKQKLDFIRWGITANWNSPTGTYNTMMYEFEGNEINMIHHLYSKGLLYRGRKPVYYSPTSHTALAESELEYKDLETPSVFVSFPLINSAFNDTYKDISLVIWTTTPWTLLANQAIGLNKSSDYSIMQNVKNSSKYIIIHVSETIPKEILEEYKVIKTIKGKDLLNSKAVHPLLKIEVPVIHGDYITTTSGTGLVHLAPGHGMDDYVVCRENNIVEMKMIVDDDGNYNCGKYKGMNVLKEGNNKIIEDLKNNKSLLYQLNFKHKYPCDWRTKQPVVIRATDQWFIKFDENLKELGKNIIDKDINFYPYTSKVRFQNTFEKNREWCISRQRVWGVPLPVFYNKTTKEPFINDEILSYAEELIRKNGSDIWFKETTENLLPEKYKSQANELVKGTDTLDVWFDSGCSWKTLLKQVDYKADVYLEGNDQHRGWFQSSFMTSLLTNKSAPFKNIITHGFTLDVQNQKMSKSLGNVVTPFRYIKGIKRNSKCPAYGTDTLRLWLASTNYSKDLTIGDDIVMKVNSVYTKTRNIIKYLLGNLYGYNPPASIQTLSFDSSYLPNQYIYYMLNEYMTQCYKAYDNYELSKVYQKTANFVTTTLSSIYFEITKNTLYLSHLKDPLRKEIQDTYYLILNVLPYMLTPITPYLSHTLPYSFHWLNDIQKKYYYYQNGSEIVKYVDKIRNKWNKPEVIKTWDDILLVRSFLTGDLEKLRKEEKKIKRFEETNVIFTALPENLKRSLQSIPHCEDIFTTSHVDFEIKPNAQVYVESTKELSDKSKVSYQIVKAEGCKCPRCWRYYSILQSEVPCPECSAIMEKINMNKK